MNKCQTCGGWYPASAKHDCLYEATKNEVFKELAKLVLAGDYKNEDVRYNMRKLALNLLRKVENEEAPAGKKIGSSNRRQSNERR